MSKETQRQINELLGDFGAKLWKVFQSSVVQSVGASAPSGPRRGRPAGSGASAPAARASVRRSSSGKGPKSTPAEVNALIGKMVDALRRHGKPMSAKDLRAAVKSEEGPFNYALNRAKDDKRVRQHGERRMARYSAGRKNARAAGKPARGGARRGRKPRAAATAPTAVAVTAPEPTATEAATS
jgi:hypothetical protein